MHAMFSRNPKLIGRYGLTNDYLVFFRASESNCKTLMHIASDENHRLRPLHLYASVEEIHMRPVDQEWEEANKPAAMMPTREDRIDYNTKHFEYITEQDSKIFTRGQTSENCILHEGEMGQCSARWEDTREDPTQRFSGDPPP